MFEISFRNFVNEFNQIKSPDNFVFYLLALFYKEVGKVAFVKNDCPYFFTCFQGSNIQKLSKGTTADFPGGFPYGGQCVLQNPPQCSRVSDLIHLNSFPA